MEVPAIVFPALPGLHFAITFGPSALLSILAIFSLGYIVISSILFYHWTAYGMGSHGIIVGELLFTIVSVLLFLTAFLSASYY